MQIDYNREMNRLDTRATAIHKSESEGEVQVVQEKFIQDIKSVQMNTIIDNICCCCTCLLHPCMLTTKLSCMSCMHTCKMLENNDG